jgi:glycine reductase complex component B subunit alpha and beta
VRVADSSGTSTDSATALVVASYNIADARQAPHMRLLDGRLEVDLEEVRELALLEPAVTEVQVSLVKPGDSIRLANVLDAVEPCVKVESPETTFAGVIGKLEPLGLGLTNRLADLAVVPLCDFRATHDLDREMEAPIRWHSIIDMDGPGRPYTHWGSTTNVVLQFTCNSNHPVAECDRAIRRATAGVARLLASATIGAVADHRETFRWDAQAAELPGIAAIIQVGADEPLLDTYFYGSSLKDTVPFLVDPREVLDGAFTAGAYEYSGVRNPTQFYQRNKLVLSLLRLHGSRIRFVGVIPTLAYAGSDFEKSRQAMIAARLARSLGATGAIVASYGTGNAQTGTMLTCRACEALGVKTTVMVSETNDGLIDHVPEADAVISVGNHEELVREWEPEATLGGRFYDVESNSPIESLGALSLMGYFGSSSQMGDTCLRTVDA